MWYIQQFGISVEEFVSVHGRLWYLWRQEPIVVEDGEEGIVLATREGLRNKAVAKKFAATLRTLIGVRRDALGQEPISPCTTEYWHAPKGAYCTCGIFNTEGHYCKEAAGRA